MKQRVITAIVLILIVVPPLLVGGWLLNLLMGVVLLLGTYEYTKCISSDTKDIYPLCALLTVATAGSVFFRQYDFQISAALLVILFTLNVWVERYDLGKIGFLFLMYRLLTTGLECFVTVRSYGFAEILFVLLMTYLTDSFALIGGMKFGKHKLNERISPKKTIEGSAGGIICATICCGVFGYFVYPQWIIHCLVMGFFGSAFSQCGDLIASMFKRKVGIKDYSNLIPGHGGVLDRFDSVLLSAPFVYYYILVVMRP